jgi:radical SAM-linked protein
MVVTAQTRDVSISRTVVQRYRLRFSRRGDARFISHLEQIEVFRKLFIRAALPLTLSQGSTPQPRIGFGPAVTVGHESESEYAELSLYKKLEPEALASQLEPWLPKGYTLISMKKIPIMFASLESLATVAAYRIEMPIEEEKVREFLAQPSCIIEKIKKDTIERVDVRPLIRRFEVSQGGIELVLKFGPKQTVKPEKVLQRVAGLDDEQTKMVPITRKALLSERSDGTLAEL